MKLPPNRFLLETGRTIYQGVAKENGKLSEEYFQSVSICEMDPEDMKELGIRENQNVKLTTEFGSVVLRAVESLRAPHRRIIYVPYGPWSNLVVNQNTNGTGMPSLKGIPVEVEASSEKVLSLPDLLTKYYRK
ncbi:MAG: formylmethanofuran dehydrogenase subunit [Thermoproteota archaeon]|nr:formylmethanofuran dehydrogenase subunit [Thermoproteota archaeon]